jgi:spore germination protein YaaH
MMSPVVMTPLAACRAGWPTTDVPSAQASASARDNSLTDDRPTGTPGAESIPSATSSAGLTADGMQPRMGVRPAQWWGYVPYFDHASAWSAAEPHRDALTGIAVVRFRPDAAGALIAFPGTVGVPEWAATQELAIVPVIANSSPDGWDREVIAHLLSTRSRQRHHVEQIVAMAVEGGHPSVEIDYESLSAADREPFSAFIEILAGALHDRGKRLAVAVHAKVSEPGAWGGSQAQDWRRIGAAADRVIVLTYDYDPARPSPIAPFSWTKDVLSYAMTQIDPAKVIQGVPLYGYDWTPGASGVGRTHRELVTLAEQYGVEPRREGRDLHVVFEYGRGRNRHQVWLSDGVTVAALLALGREVGVGGYAFWRLGGEDPAVWPALEAERATLSDV